jgi:hypothetical protein
MLIQCHDRFDVIAEFDPNLDRILLQARPPGLAETVTDGWFSILDGVCVVFYREGSRLWLRVGSRTFDLDGDTSVNWEREGSSSSFSVADSDGQIVLRYEAGPFIGPPLEEDPTPFVEAEHWDLGLFVANVMSDDARADRIRHRRLGA